MVSQSWAWWWSKVYTNTTPAPHACHRHILTLTHTLSHHTSTPSHPHTHTQRHFFVTLAFGLKGQQDVLEGEEKQESQPTREDSRGRRNHCHQAPKAPPQAHPHEWGEFMMPQPAGASVHASLCRCAGVWPSGKYGPGGHSRTTPSASWRVFNLLSMIPLIIISYDSVLTCNKIVGGNSLLNTSFFGGSSLSGKCGPSSRLCPTWPMGTWARH